MKKDPPILKYLNLYRGSEFYFLTGGIKYHGIVESVMATGCYGNDCDATMYLDEMKDGNDFKLILISPTDMSGAQKRRYYSLTKKVENTIVDTPESLRYCFSIGVDVFDLIEKGLAVDKKSVVYKKIIQKDSKDEDEEVTIVEINNTTPAPPQTETPPDKRSDIVGGLYELIVSQNVIPFKEEESPFKRNHSSVWDSKYLKFSHEGVEWSIRKDTRFRPDFFGKYKIGDNAYMVCNGISGIRMWTIKDLIGRIKERISGKLEVKQAPVPEKEPIKSAQPIPKKEKAPVVKRAKYVPDPNWQPPRKFTLND